MELNYFDLIIGTIVLLLGLKGILNGFFKEIFGLVGIVGGVFVASRLAGSVGESLNEMIFHFDNKAAVSFTGFLVVLIIFWVSMVVAGILFKKLTAASGLGIFDRILGFVFGASKFFLIISVIVYAIWNIKTIRDNLEKPMQNSILFPIMVQAGGFIMKLDPIEQSQKIKEGIESTKKRATEIIEQSVKEKIQEGEQKIQEEVKQQIVKEADGE